MKPSELRARLKLAQGLLCRPDSAAALLAAFGSAEAALEAGPKAWEPSGIESLDEASRLHGLAVFFDAESELEALEKLGGTLLLRGEPGYPAALSGLDDAPAALYMLGRFDDRACLAVVGSRKAQPYGLRMARKLVHGAAGAGLAVASGAARGIDGAAHEAALEAGAATWAVLGSGLMQLYPPEHKGLLRRIVEGGGAVLSEYALRTTPFPDNFPRRNRIISGLSFATVVVEADLKSGSLHTARRAAEQGRAVLAVPGSVESPLSRGPHELLRKGAAPIESIEDALAELPAWAKPAPPTAAPRAPDAAPAGRELLDAIGPDSRSFDELAASLGWESALLAEALLELELQGSVVALPGKRFAKR